MESVVIYIVNPFPGQRELIDLYQRLIVPDNISNKYNIVFQIVPFSSFLKYSFVLSPFSSGNCLDSLSNVSYKTYLKEIAFSVFSKIRRFSVTNVIYFYFFIYIFIFFIFYFFLIIFFLFLFLFFILNNYFYFIFIFILLFFYLFFIFILIF